MEDYFMLILVTLYRDGLDVTKGNECWSCSWEDLIRNKKADKFREALRSHLYYILSTRKSFIPDPRLDIRFRLPKGEMNAKKAKRLADDIAWKLRWLDKQDKEWLR